MSGIVDQEIFPRSVAVENALKVDIEPLLRDRYQLGKLGGAGCESHEVCMLMMASLLA